MSRDVHYHASGTRQAGSRDQVTPLNAIKEALQHAREDYSEKRRFCSLRVLSVDVQRRGTARVRQRRRQLDGEQRGAATP